MPELMKEQFGWFSSNKFADRTCHFIGDMGNPSKSEDIAKELL